MTMGRPLAAAQTVPQRGDITANLEEHLRLVRAAAQARACVLVFPELSLTGYELDLATELAFSEGDARLTPLIDVAAAHDMTLVVGAPARIDRRLHIGAFILAPDRSIRLYTKQRMGAFPPEVNPGGPVPPPEASVFSPGDRNPLVEVGATTAAVAVCADIGRASHPAEAAARGANTYLASMFVIPGDFEMEMAKLRSYASAHSMSVVFANFGGPSGGLPSAGCSAIISPRGEFVVQLPGEGAGVALGSYDERGWRGDGMVL